MKRENPRNRNGAIEETFRGILQLALSAPYQLKQLLLLSSSDPPLTHEAAV